MINNIKLECLENLKEYLNSMQNLDPDNILIAETLIKVESECEQLDAKILDEVFDYHE